jgi:hypothetical protein
VGVVSPSLMVKRSQLMKAVMKASISWARPMPGCFNLRNGLPWVVNNGEKN